MNRKVVLDEGVPKVIARKLRDFGLDVIPFPNEWKQISNGVLLRQIKQAGFGVLVTNDKRMQYQQNLQLHGIAIVVLPTNIRLTLLPKVFEIADAIRRCEPGAVLSLQFTPKSGG